MQGISVYRVGDDVSVDKPIYHTFHERNGEYLERENEPNRFRILAEIDDCDPNFFSGYDLLNNLILDLDSIIEEANLNNDGELSNHLKEVLVLCKLCVWNVNDFWLYISPYERVAPTNYPETIIEKFKYNISGAGTKTT